MTLPQDPARWGDGPEKLDAVDVTVGPGGISWARYITGGPLEFPVAGMKWLAGYAMVAGEIGDHPDGPLLPVIVLCIYGSETPGGKQDTVWPIAMDIEAVVQLHDGLEHMVVGYAEVMGQEGEDDAPGAD